MESLPAEFSRVYFRDQPPMGGWPETFAVVTAHNPEGVVDDPSANDTADLSLRQEIERAGLIHFRVTGGSLDGRHQEPGWGIMLATPELARDLSERFEQLAYFWVENGRLFLVDTQTGERFQQSAWLDRLLGEIRLSTVRVVRCIAGNSCSEPLRMISTSSLHSD